MKALAKLRLRLAETDVLLAEEILYYHDIKVLSFGCKHIKTRHLDSFIKTLTLMISAEYDTGFSIIANKDFEREIVKIFIFCKKAGRPMRVGVLQFFDTINCFLNKNLYIDVEII